jgi:hypothetical protein
VAEWIVCPTCNLRHSVRKDLTCPKCQQSVAHALPPGAVSTPPPLPVVAPDAPEPPPLPDPGPPAEAFNAGRFCQTCGAAGPTARVEYHQNIGALVMRFHRSLKAEVCPKCASKHFWEMTLITLFAGWWGVISFFMTPFILLMNVIQYLGYRPQAALGVAPPPLPGGQRKGLAIASLVAAVIGLFTLGIGAVVGFGLGIAALFKASRNPQEYGGRGIAAAGVAVSVLGFVPLLFGLLMLIGSTQEPRPRAAGEEAFRTANQKIFAYHDQVAFGNTPDAQAMAQRFSTLLKSMVAIGFTGGGKGGPSLSEGNFLTYCEVRDDRICFLVHVPELRRYKGDVRDALVKIAWMTAQQVTEGRRKGHDVKLAVGLRGALSYGAVAAGMGEGEPQKTMAEALDEKPLFEFFADAPARPTAAR